MQTREKIVFITTTIIILEKICREKYAMLIMLFGLSGSGKNYVGEILKNKFNYFFWDADEALTEEMKQCIKNKKSFTQEMRDRYFSIVIDKIKSLHNIYPNLVISQALYRNINRRQILSAFPDVFFIQIATTNELIIKRLRSRGDFIDEGYADLISKNFEEPSMMFATITNNSDELSIIEQFQGIMNKYQVTLPIKPSQLSITSQSKIKSQYFFGEQDQLALSYAQDVESETNKSPVENKGEIIKSKLY